MRSSGRWPRILQRSFPAILEVDPLRTAMMSPLEVGRTIGIGGTMESNLRPAKDNSAEFCPYCQQGIRTPRRLLIRTSRWSATAVNWLAARLMLSERLTSSDRKLAFPPSASIPLAACRPLPSSRAPMTMWNPRRDNCRAVSRPIPISTRDESDSLSLAERHNHSFRDVDGYGRSSVLIARRSSIAR